jgi:hypothetical protein
MSHKIDSLWKLRESQAAEIRFADSKAGAASALSLGLIAATLSTAAAVAPRVAEPWSTIAKTAAGLSCLCLIATLVLTSLAIRPRFSWSRGDDARGSRRDRARTGAPPRRSRPAALRLARASARRRLAGHVHTHAVVLHTAADAFRKSWVETDEEALAKELAEDLWRTALICERKFRWISKAVWCSASSAFFGLIALLLLVIGQ